MEILLKDDLMNRLKISEATLYRWVSESRTGSGTFPLPISQPGRTLRWNSDEVDAWCQSKTRVAVTSSSRKTKNTAKDRERRHEAVLKAMQRHGLDGKMT